MIPGIATSWKTIDDDDLGVQAAQGRQVPRRQRADRRGRRVLDRPRAARSRTAPARSSPTPRRSSRKEIVDPYTIRFKTAAPYPLAPNDLSTIYIVSKKVATGATTEDFNTGKAAIGSGRYKFVTYVSGDRVELVRNDNYWGDKPPWDKVTFKIIKNEPARVAALLSGDVDAIEQPPTADLARIKADPEVHGHVEDLAPRHLLQLRPPRRASSPFITDKAGKPLDEESAARRARAPRDLARRSTGRRSPSA